MKPTPMLCCARLIAGAMLALPVFAILATPSLHAQSSATISGTVFDPRGVALPGADIRVKNEATGAIQKAVSDNSGK